jgi:predicted DNA-binding protein YlxM (UPF0122 family)
MAFSHLTPEQRQATLDELMRTRSLTKAAALFGINPMDVQYMRKKAGIGPFVTLLSKKEMDEMVLLYKTGLSSYEVARKLNRSYKSVTNALERAGENTRDAHHCNKQLSVKEDYFESIDTPTKAYLLGFIFADGNTFGTRFKMSLAEVDKYFLEMFKAEIEHTGDLYFEEVEKEERQNMWSLTIYSKKMTDDLKRHGVIENKENRVEYPRYLPNELRRYFFHGLLDGDGCVTADKVGRGTTLSVSIHGAITLIPEIRNAIREETGLKGIFIKKKKGHGCRVSFRGTQAILMANYLYEMTSKFFLKRKLYRYKDILSMLRLSYDNRRPNTRKQILEGERIINLHEQTPYFTSN